MILITSLLEEQKATHKREDDSKNKEAGGSLPKKPPAQIQSGWREATTPDGQKYYWNIITKESAWTLPEGVTVEPELLTVKQEKNKLQQFVLNRLVELSESGSTEATAAVHRAFNAPIPPAYMNEENKSNAFASKPVESPEPCNQPVFHGPKVDLLGQWTLVDDR